MFRLQLKAEVVPALNRCLYQSSEPSRAAQEDRVGTVWQRLAANSKKEFMQTEETTQGPEATYPLSRG